MSRTDALRQDHLLLRNKLGSLEAALSTVPYARFAFRERCSSFLRLLTRHINREQPFLRVYYERVPSARYLSTTPDHTAEHALLRSITELLVGGVRVSVPLMILRISQAMECLREHMEEQERTIFPVLEELLAASGTAEGLALAGTSSISPTMSVNAILQRYPRTASVFNRLQVNRSREGYESLDEVVWRHGRDVGQVLTELRRVVGEPAATGRPTSAPTPGSAAASSAN